MESKYEISDDGSIFYIGDDGTIHRVGKINGEGNVEGKTKSKGNGVLWFFLVVVIIISVFLWINLSSAENELRYIRNMESENENLKKQNSTLTSILPFRVDKIEMGNTDREGNIIDYYGSNLDANRMRYLTPKVDYTGFVHGKSVTVCYKIYNPNGKLEHNYSYSTTYTGGDGDSRTIYEGSDNMILSGWGSAYTSTYLVGKYRIEIWCNEICLGTESFWMD